MSAKTAAEVTSARLRLDSTLQNLVEKKDESYLPNELETPATHSEKSQRLPSPVQSPRKSSLGKVSRKRKRKEDDGSEQGSYHHTYVMKLFDRSVDLAQFDDNTPLYPICRSWMRNQPHNRNLLTKARSPTPDLEQQVSPDEESLDRSSVYCLPSPVKRDPAEERKEPAIPSVLPKSEEKLDIHADPDKAPAPEQLLLNHMSRWKNIRQKWRDASRHNEMRYGTSLNILKDMYDRHCKDA